MANYKFDFGVCHLKFFYRRRLCSWVLLHDLKEKSQGSFQSVNLVLFIYFFFKLQILSGNFQKREWLGREVSIPKGQMEICRQLVRAPLLSYSTQGRILWTLKNFLHLISPMLMLAKNTWKCICGFAHSHQMNSTEMKTRFVVICGDRQKLAFEEKYVCF